MCLCVCASGREGVRSASSEVTVTQECATYKLYQVCPTTILHTTNYSDARVRHKQTTPHYQLYRTTILDQISNQKTQLLRDARLLIAAAMTKVHCATLYSVLEMILFCNYHA